MIQINSLFYAYDPDDGPVLKDLNLTIRPGRYVGIIGPNGSGKTTLTRHLNGLLTPTSGDVWVEGINTKQTDQLHRIRQSIGMVFQNPDDQIVGMSVEEDVSFGPGNMGLAPSEIRKRVRTALERVSMAGKATKPPIPCPTARSSGLPLQEFWPWNPGPSSLMNRPPIWIRLPASRCSPLSGNSTSKGSPSFM